MDFRSRPRNMAQSADCQIETFQLDERGDGRRHHGVRADAQARTKTSGVPALESGWVEAIVDNPGSSLGHAIVDQRTHYGLGDADGKWSLMQTELVPPEARV